MRRCHSSFKYCWVCKLSSYLFIHSFILISARSLLFAHAEWNSKNKLFFPLLHELCKIIYLYLKLHVEENLIFLENFSRWSRAQQKNFFRFSYFLIFTFLMTAHLHMRLITDFFLLLNCWTFFCFSEQKLLLSDNNFKIWGDFFCQDDDEDK